jgi:SAM-dependent methyltransferase
MHSSLTEIANHHGTDKGTIGPSPDFPGHNYTDIYEAYLGRFRQSPVTLLEIGLGVVGDRWDAKIVQGRNTGGASLKMWYDYFPNARIYGLDINDCSYLANDRVRTFVADQGKVEDLAAFVDALDEAAFDIVIDDGSHRPDHQQIALSYLFKHLRPGGLYFIEDLMANGFSDGKTGRMASEEVRNTRSVLKHYLKQGTFFEPHALTGSDVLVQEIADVHFHVPAIVVEAHGGGSSPQTGVQPVSYGSDTESLCVIRKR